MPKLKSKQKQELIDHLVGNCECEGESMFDESDMNTLKKMDLDQLRAFEANEEGEEASDAEATENSGTQQIASNSSNDSNEDKEVTNSEFNEQALPAGIRADLEFARRTRLAQRNKLVDSITANAESGIWSKEDLEAMDLEQLSKIERVVSNAKKENSSPAPKPTNNSGELGDDGYWKPPRMGGNLVGNQQKVDQSEALPLPSMSFEPLQR